MDGAASDKKDLSQLDIVGIMELIPHRYPMILVDRVVDIVQGESCTGIKNVTINEGFFQGHFPRRPVMPGVMIVESMAQTAAILVVKTLGEDAKGKLVYFMTVDNARFRRPVVPGDSMRVHVKRLQQRRNVWKFSGKVMVEDVLVAEAEFAAMIMDDL
jgi:3-hydroxyacyl-[acyl-carrier-protein] dehydratase